MRDIPFVAARVHLWFLARMTYPWLTPPFSEGSPNGIVEPIAQTYLLDDYLADACGWNVVGIVHVIAGRRRALRWTIRAGCRRWPRSVRCQGIVAFAALDNPGVERSWRRMRHMRTSVVFGTSSIGTLTRTAPTLLET